MEFFDINLLNKNINKKDINYKNLLYKLYEKSGLEEYYKNITNINNNTIIFGLKSKRIKKKLIKKKTKSENFQ